MSQPTITASWVKGGLQIQIEQQVNHPRFGIATSTSTHFIPAPRVLLTSALRSLLDGVKWKPPKT